MPDHTSIEQLERRVKADPTSIAFAALAEEYRRAGRFREAIEVCRAGLARHPAYLSARVTLGRALIEVGELDAAKAELEQVLAAAPENLAAIRALAEIHHRRGEIPEATEHYRTALEITEQHALSQPTATGAQTAAEDEGLSLESFEQSLERARSAPAAASSRSAPLPSPTPAPSAPPALAELERWLAAIERLRLAREREARV
jgi:tetratricopeptide (TPR) repeat protein